MQSLLQMYSSPHASLDRMWLNNLLVTGTVVSKDGEWWYIAWSHTVGAIGWELNKIEVDGRLFWVLEQTRSSNPLKVLAVIEEGDYTVNTITVLSKTMQIAMLGAASSRNLPSFVLLSNEGSRTMSLLESCARSGFRGWTIPSLKDLTRLVQKKKGAIGGTLQDILKLLLGHCLPFTDDEEIGAILIARGIPLKPSVFKTVLTADAAAHCYDLLAEDMDELTSEAKKTEEQPKKQEQVRQRKAPAPKSSTSASSAQLVVAASASSSSSSAPTASEPPVSAVVAALVQPSEEPLPLVLASDAASSSCKYPVKPSSGSIHTVAEANMLKPPGAGSSVQLNRGGGWTAKMLHRTTPGRKSNTNSWGPKSGLTSEQALGRSLHWAWTVYMEEGGEPPPFNIFDMLPEEDQPQDA